MIFQLAQNQPVSLSCSETANQTPFQGPPSQPVLSSAHLGPDLLISSHYQESGSHLTAFVLTDLSSDATSPTSYLSFLAFSTGSNVTDYPPSNNRPLCSFILTGSFRERTYPPEIVLVCHLPLPRAYKH